jgi:hypothetical protein
VTRRRLYAVPRTWKGRRGKRLSNVPSRSGDRPSVNGSGARSRPWPASSWPGRGWSPWPRSPPLGAKKASPPRLRLCLPLRQHRKPPVPAPRQPLVCGPARSPPRSLGCRPSRPAHQPEPTRRQEGKPGGPAEPARPAQQPDSRAHQTLNIRYLSCTSRRQSSPASLRFTSSEPDRHGRLQRRRINRRRTHEPCLMRRALSALARHS